MKLYDQYLLKSAFIPSKDRFIRDFFDRLFGQPPKKGSTKGRQFYSKATSSRA